MSNKKFLENSQTLIMPHKNVFLLKTSIFISISDHPVSGGRIMKHQGDTNQDHAQAILHGLLVHCLHRNGCEQPACSSTKPHSHPYIVPRLRRHTLLILDLTSLTQHHTHERTRCLQRYCTLLHKLSMDLAE